MNRMVERKGVNFFKFYKILMLTLLRIKIKWFIIA